MKKPKFNLKVIFLALLAWVSCSTAFAQPLNFAWAKQYGGTTNATPICMKMNANGDIYTAGTFFSNGIGDFDPGPGVTNHQVTFGNYNAFISKLDKFGNFLWVKQFTIFSINSMALDANSNILIAGRFGATQDFDPSPSGTFTMTSAGGGDIFVEKLDSAGNFLWAKSMGSTANEQAEGITVDASGNVYTTGYFQGSVDFNPSSGTSNLVSAGNYDIFVQKLDPSGNFVWAKRIGGSGQDLAKCITIDPSGNIGTTGYFVGTVDFDPGSGTHSLASANAESMFVSKLNSSGNYVSAFTIGGSGALPLDMVFDASSNIQVVGWFTTALDFDPGPGTMSLLPSGTRDAFIYKLNASGTLLWAKQLGVLGRTEAWGIALDGLGNSFTIGRFDNTVDLDPGPNANYANTAGGYDIFCVNLDASGNLIWPYKYGGSLGEQYADIALAPNGAVYSTGNSSSIMDCDPSSAVFFLDTIGENTAFVHKLSACTPSDSAATVAACSSYSVDGYTFTHNTDYIKTLENSVGCDSIFTLNIEIKNNDSTLTVATCDSFILNNLTYLSSGTYSQLLTNVAGCDSVLTLDLTIRNSSVYALQDTACGSYSLNGQAYSTSGTYVQHLANVGSCDSTIILDLIIHQASSSTVNATGCNTYTLNGQTYTQQGVYNQYLTNFVGCDSLLTLHLTMEFALTTVTQSGNMLTAVQNSATYQWVDCSSGNSPIPGATLQSFTPSVSGNYAVIVTNGNCSDTSLCTNVTIVGVQPQPNEPQIHCFPNPSDGRITITLGQLEDTISITILNVHGQIVGQRACSQTDRIQLDMPFESGLYFVKLESSLGTQVVKVVRK